MLHADELVRTTETPHYTLHETGSAEDVKPKTTAGLLLAGGGGDVDAAMRWFIERAGGGDIVVLRAGGGAGYHDYLYERLGGVNSVRSIVFKDKAASSDPKVLELLAGAEGIFLAGGDQAKYVEFWTGTPVADALNAHFAAGKPLGGTSAGLAVLTEFSFTARKDTVVSAEALADPQDPRVTVERSFVKVAPLVGTISDTHFGKRERLGRLLAFLARIQEDFAPPRVVGLGVDEKTALCVDADGKGVVKAEGDGRVSVLVPTEKAAPTKSGPLTIRNVRRLTFGNGESVDLATVAATAAERGEVITVSRGVLGDVGSPP